MPRIDLTTATPYQLATILRSVCITGAEDEENGEPEKTGQQLVEQYAHTWLKGHARIFRHAYYAGRWHAQCLKQESQQKKLGD